MLKIRKIPTHDPEIHREASKQGLINEHRATVWLLEQGYEVYKNVLPIGTVDLIAIKDSKVIKLDVKTLKVREDGPIFSWKIYLSEEQINSGIVPLFVKDGKVGWNRDYF